MTADDPDQTAQLVVTILLNEMNRSQEMIREAFGSFDRLLQIALLVLVGGATIGFSEANVWQVLIILPLPMLVVLMVFFNRLLEMGSRGGYVAALEIRLNKLAPLQDALAWEKRIAPELVHTSLINKASLFLYLLTYVGLLVLSGWTAYGRLGWLVAAAVACTGALSLLLLIKCATIATLAHEHSKTLALSGYEDHGADIEEPSVS